MILELASRRTLPNNGGNMIEIKPLSYLDPRLFAPAVDYAPIAEGNLAATKSVMAGVSSAVNSVGGAYAQSQANDLSAAHYSDNKADKLFDRQFKQAQLDQTGEHQRGMLSLYKNSEEAGMNKINAQREIAGLNPIGGPLGTRTNFSSFNLPNRGQ